MAASHRVHPRAIVGDGVELGTDVTVGPGAVLLGPLKVGDRAWIGPNAVLGTPPEIASLRQNAAWEGDLDHAGVEIGEDVVIRELCTVHQGSRRTTVIGAGSWLLNSVYVAHDCIVGREVTLSAGVRLGGHSVIGDLANIGMNAAVHQYRVVGSGAMIGMGSPVTHDVPPFAKAYGSPVRLHGLNAYVVRKLGVREDVLSRLQAACDGADYPLDQLDGVPELAEFVKWWRSQEPSRAIGNGCAS
jgi:UDP-N-acetylglucosamine acyltransferase